MHGSATGRLAAASAALHCITLGLLLLVCGRLSRLEGAGHALEEIPGSAARLGRRLHQVSRLRRFGFTSGARKVRLASGACWLVPPGHLPSHWLRARTRLWMLERLLCRSPCLPPGLTARGQQPPTAGRPCCHCMRSCRCRLSAVITLAWPPASPLRPDVQDSEQLNRGAGRQLLADGTFDVRPQREAAAAAA